MTRQKVLEQFLNDKVEAIKPFNSLFFWRDMLYEVFPYNKILKDKSRKASHFIKYIAGSTLYGIREVSPEVLYKHYITEYNKRLSN